MTRVSILWIGLAVIAVAGAVTTAVRNKGKPETAVSSASAPTPASARRLLSDDTVTPSERAELLRWAKERPAPARPKPESLSVTFAAEGGNKVTLDYIDAQNYRFTTQNNALQTYVLDGRIYLYAPADAVQPERLWLYGRLDATPAQQVQTGSPQPALKPTTIPPAGVAAWGNVGNVSDVTVSISGPIGIPVDVTVAKLALLAHAQWAITTLLLPAMDMALCGDGVQATTTWWPQDLTSAGFAIVATSAGVRLDGPVRKSSGSLSLPATATITIHPLARF
jgi:hypothetical protein